MKLRIPWDPVRNAYTWAANISKDSSLDPLLKWAFQVRLCIPGVTRHCRNWCHPKLFPIKHLRILTPNCRVSSHPGQSDGTSEFGNPPIHPSSALLPRLFNVKVKAYQPQARNYNVCRVKSTKGNFFAQFHTGKSVHASGTLRQHSGEFMPWPHSTLSSTLQDNPGQRAYLMGGNAATWSWFLTLILDTQVMLQVSFVHHIKTLPFGLYIKTNLY